MKKIKLFRSPFSYEHEFYRNNKLNMIMAYLISTFVALTNIAIAFIMKKLMEVATQNDIRELYKIILMSVAFLIVDLMLSLLYRYFYSAFVRKAIGQYKEKVFTDVLARDINSFDEEVISKYLSAFSNDVEIIEESYLKGTIGIYNKTIHLVGGIISMVCLDLFMTIFTLISSVLSILISFCMRSKLINLEKEKSFRNEEFMNFTKNMLSGFSIIKSFKAENEVINSFKKTNLRLENVKKDKKMTTDLMYALSRTASYVTNFVVFIIGGYLAIVGKSSIGTIIAFIQLLNYVISPLEKLGPAYAERTAAKGLIEKIESGMSIESSHPSINKDSFENHIEFRNVNYGYSEETNVLKNVSVNFAKGKSYALVGGSGSGKTTLLRMMLGYSKNYDGEICIDDVELRSISRDSLYGLFSVIQQDVFIFDDSIINNITMYKNFSEEEVNSVITKSGLGDLVKSKGLEYQCGENGCNLSGGEKQRISIARCILRKTPIILMDEATSSLDNSTAFHIEREILGLNDMTKIVVTHKLEEELLKMYDEILVVSKGKIVENGTFEELIRKEQYFYSLYNVTNELI